MKIFVAVNNCVHDIKPLATALLADSALTNTGKPFYIPENVGRVEVALAPAVRINRLGKNISPKFGQRYFNEHAAAIHFLLTDLEEDLKSKGLPTDDARSFDKALFVGAFLPFSPEFELELHINGRFEDSFNYPQLKKDIPEVLADISRRNTMKMGDLILPGISGRCEVEAGNLVEVFANGIKAFDVRIK